MKCDLAGNWVGKDVAKTWPEGIVVVARRMPIPVGQYGAVDLTTYFRPDQIDRIYGDDSLFLRLTPEPAKKVVKK